VELVAIIICQPSALPHFCLFLSVRNGRSAVLAVRLVCSTLQFYCAGELIRHGSTERERERERRRGECCRHCWVYSGTGWRQAGLHDETIATDLIAYCRIQPLWVARALFSFCRQRFDYYDARATESYRLHRDRCGLV